jgi:hypothetical protein
VFLRWCCEQPGASCSLPVLEQALNHGSKSRIDARSLSIEESAMNSPLILYWHIVPNRMYGKTIYERRHKGFHRPHDMYRKTPARDPLQGIVQMRYIESNVQAKCGYVRKLY